MSYCDCQKKILLGFIVRRSLELFQKRSISGFLLTLHGNSYFAHVDLQCTLSPPLTDRKVLCWFIAGSDLLIFDNAIAAFLLWRRDLAELLNWSMLLQWTEQQTECLSFFTVAAKNRMVEGWPRTCFAKLFSFGCSLGFKWMVLSQSQ